MKTQNFICTVLRKRSYSTTDRKKTIRLKRETYKLVFIILGINLTAVSLSTFQVIKLQKGAQFLELVIIETVEQIDIKGEISQGSSFVLFSGICFNSRKLVFHYLLLFIAAPKISSFKNYQIISTKHLALLCW